MWVGKHTIATLKKQLESAKSGDGVTIPGADLRALFNLIDRIRSPKAARLDRVRALSTQFEAYLSRDELVLLLNLAIETKLKQLESRSGVAGLPVATIRHVNLARRNG